MLFLNGDSRIRETGEDVQRFQFWDMRVDRFVQGDMATFYELHGAEGGHEFGAGCDPHHGVEIHGFG